MPCVIRAADAADLPAVRHRGPVGRYREHELPSRFEIRLIEHRHRAGRARRHEQRIQEVVAAIERRIAGHELEFDDVLAP